MRRSTLLVLLALVLAAPAAAKDKPKPVKPAVVTLSGTLVARSTSAVAVRNGPRTVKCSVGTASPKLGDLKVGDRVRISCTNGVLTAISRPNPLKSTPTTAPPVVQTAAGTVAAVDDGSITLHTDGGNVTCTISASSPRPAGLKVGDRAKIGCTNGVLTAVARIDAPKPPDPNVKTASGTIVSLTDGALTVHTDGGDLTCSLASTSPRLGDFHVGDKVKLACTSGVLTTIAKVDPPKPPTTTRTGVGTLTALSTSSVTVRTDGGDVTCSVGADSKVGDAKVGDQVKFGCINGVLYALVKVAPPSQPVPPPTNVRSAVGPIGALSSDAITVTGDGGPVTCAIGPKSPSTAEFHVGDHVKMYCVDDALYALIKA